MTFLVDSSLESLESKKKSFLVKNGGKCKKINLIEICTICSVKLTVVTYGHTELIKGKSLYESMDFVTIVAYFSTAVSYDIKLFETLTTG